MPYRSKRINPYWGDAQSIQSFNTIRIPMKRVMTSLLTCQTGKLIRKKSKLTTISKDSTNNKEHNHIKDTTDAHSKKIHANFENLLTTSPKT